jgi:nucleotide-binding universal stress UspA family protein
VLAEVQHLMDGQWTASLRKAGVEYATRIVRGDPATELLRAATRTNASMLVLGSKSHGAIADMIVGGTVHKVINRSTLPVVLVPAPRKPTAARKPSAGQPSR